MRLLEVPGVELLGHDCLVMQGPQQMQAYGMFTGHVGVCELLLTLHTIPISSACCFAVVTSRAAWFASSVVMADSIMFSVRRFSWSSALNTKVSNGAKQASMT